MATSFEDTPRDVLAALVKTWHPRAAPLSPLHGRTRTVRVPRLGWVSFKGGGWTWGERSVLVSRKDAQLVFGLFGRVDAEREQAVSHWLQTRLLHAARVLGWARVSELGVFENHVDLAGTRFLDGTLVDPAILVTLNRVPVRVADLAFITGTARERWLSRACRATGWRRDRYALEFAGALGRALAALHLAGATNDTLTWDNVTLAAEWTDFEWLYVPGHPLPDGSTDERLAERQWKSCVDGFEVVDRLATFLGAGAARRLASIRVCLDAYEHAGGPVPIRQDWSV